MSKVPGEERTRESIELKVQQKMFYLDKKVDGKTMRRHHIDEVFYSQHASSTTAQMMMKPNDM